MRMVSRWLTWRGGLEKRFSISWVALQRKWTTSETAVGRTALQPCSADLKLDRYQPHVAKIAYDFLNGSEQEAAQVLAGLLLVIYRLRNNMFHGPKWFYGIQWQYDNFTKCSVVLKWVLSL